MTQRAKSSADYQASADRAANAAIACGVMAVVCVLINLACQISGWDPNIPVPIGIAFLATVGIGGLAIFLGLERRRKRVK